MVNFLKKRLQVFVSSTYLDLKQERQAAVSAILTSGHIPAGMELFTAGDESQMTVIKQWIDESDVFLLILGSRYGSIDPKTGKSYTHLEYDYALSQNKPLFALVIEDSAIEERVRKLDISFLEQKNSQKLQEFRDFTLTKLSGFWSDTKDIQLEVIKTLQDFARREDLTGWIKGNESVNTVALTEELTRLSQENAQLREENQLLNKKLNINANSNTLGLSFPEMKSFLESYEVSKEDISSDLHQYFEISLEEIEKIEIQNLLDLFKIVGIKLVGDDVKIKTEASVCPELLKLCNKKLLRYLTSNYVFEYKFTIENEGYHFLNWLNNQT